MIKKTTALGGLLSCLVLAGVWMVHNKPGKAPDISLQFLDGRNIELHSLRGRPLLITFWATTCSTCIQEMPHLISLYEELSDRGLEIISVAMPYDPPSRVVQFSNSRKIPYPIALDIDGKVTQAFGQVSVTPTSILISPGGDIVFQKMGKMDMNKLKRQIIDLLPQHQQVTIHKSQRSGNKT